jgi:UDP-N-acetylmuramoylalanine--D-glutamate ligase
MEKGLTIRGVRVVVVGLGRSGAAAAMWLAGRGADVTVSDVRSRDDFDPDLIRRISDAGVRLEAGGHDPGTFSGSGLIVISPGVPYDIPPVAAARAAGVRVLGEMELACRFLDIPMVGVTGTNGKSTVTSLVGEMLQRDGRRVFVGGNIGTPLITLASCAGDFDCAAVEVSSYQLDAMESFRPEVSVLLNISPDHLDRYPDYEAYVQSKLKIFRGQAPGGAVVLNDDDETLSRVDPGPHLRVLRYGLEKARGRAAWISKDRVVAGVPHAGSMEVSLERFAPPGGHNRENAAAAVLAALAFGAGREAVQDAIDSFKGLRHRLELIAESGGVAFDNDSKATNVDAAVRAVLSFERPLVLVAGGRHKGADYGPLVNAARGRVKGAVFLGESRSLLARAFRGVLPVRVAGGLEDAVAEATGLAEPGDAVLFSPACSSFDMFNDYEHRGKAYIEAVKEVLSGDKKQ